MKHHTTEGEPSGTVRTKEEILRAIKLANGKWLVNMDGLPKEAIYYAMQTYADQQTAKKDEEIERLKVQKVNEAVIKRMMERPGIVSGIAANEIRKNEALTNELATLREETAELRKELGDTKANLGRAYDGVNYWKPLAEKQRDELTATRSLLDRMAEHLKKSITNESRRELLQEYESIKKV